MPRTSRRTLPARMNLRHIRGTKFLTAPAQRAGTFRQKQESSTGRDAGAHDLVAAGVPARHFLDPGSESGVTPRFAG